MQGPQASQSWIVSLASFFVTQPQWLSLRTPTMRARRRRGLDVTDFSDREGLKSTGRLMLVFRQGRDLLGGRTRGETVRQLIGWKKCRGASFATRGLATSDSLFLSLLAQRRSSPHVVIMDSHQERRPMHYVDNDEYNKLKYIHTEVVSLIFCRSLTHSSSVRLGYLSTMKYSQPHSTEEQKQKVHIDVSLFLLRIYPRCLHLGRSVGNSFRLKAP